jgi:hypothetical protein
MPGPDDRAEALRGAFAGASRGLAEGTGRGRRRGRGSARGRTRGGGRGRGSGSGRGRRSGVESTEGDKGTGDWNCASCGNYNYKFRDACNKCGAARGAEAGAGAEVVGGAQKTITKKKQKQKQGQKRGKGPRQRVKQLTQQIVQFAKRKQLGDAQRVFRQLKHEGLTPALLTYSTFINAHVTRYDLLVTGPHGVVSEVRFVAAVT